MKSLYIHIPFCRQKCFYCSFAVSVGQELKVGPYLECLGTEAKEYQQENLSSIYLGGGTPTFINEDQLEKLFKILQENFIYPPSIEYTIEANPEGITLEKARLLKNLGVNRISLGIQSLNDRHLKFLGRNHGREDAVKAFDNLRRAGFDNISVDMMSTFPAQEKRELEHDLEEMIRLGSEHISVYALTIEEKSRFFVKNVRLPEGGIQAERYQKIAERLEAGGYQQYEISNFAKKGRESRHNINYWRGGNYIGLGMSAHSHQDGRRYWNVDRLSEYIRLIKENKSPKAGEENLGAPERFIEALLLGLRMNAGVNIKELEERFECILDAERRKKITEFIAARWLFFEGDFLKASPQGRLLLDEISVRVI